MKNLLVLLAAVLLISSCDDNFKVGAEYKEVTIAYGLLDDGSTTNQHFIKITKGFYSDEIDNLLLAANKDSIYFKDLTVTVEEYLNGNKTNTFTCAKVDLNTLPQPIIKRTGIFVDSPNYAYMFTHDLDPTRQYKLSILNNESGKLITGETDIINVSGNNFQVIRPFTAFDKLIFANPEKSYVFSWKAPANAALFDILLRFHYSEENLITNTKSKKSVDLPLAKFIKRTGTTMSYDFSNQVFFSLLTSNIGAAGLNVNRRVDTAELFFIAGDNELKNYIDVNNAQGGLTADQIKPNYPNLKGENAIGIFASRGTKAVGFITYDDATYDSIINGSNTRSLNFIGRSLD